MAPSECDSSAASPMPMPGDCGHPVAANEANLSQTDRMILDQRGRSGQTMDPDLRLRILAH